MKEIIIALDTDDLEKAKSLVDQLSPLTKWFKVGMEGYYSHGEELLSYLSSKSCHTFLDLKLHDIPTTVRKSLLALTNKYSIAMINVHALGGSEMLHEAVKGIQSREETKLLGVTVLTSFDERELQGTFKNELSSLEMVQSLNTLCLEAHLDGVVCSPLEAKTIQSSSPENYLIVTPGVRLNAPSDDQKRVMTPKDAFANGSTHIVIGREVTLAKSPYKALKEIKESFI